MAAFGGEQLRTQQVFSPASLVQQIPGITINTADKSLSIVAIRGNVSTFRTATLDTPVAYFMDDIYYVFNNDLNANFYDIQRVEVLRGPQGTLFGRNVVGGAISVVTNNPEMKEDYFGQVTGGNGGYLRTEGMFNAPIVDDKVAARFAFSTERGDGLINTPTRAAITARPRAMPCAASCSSSRPTRSRSCSRATIPTPPAMAARSSWAWAAIRRFPPASASSPMRNGPTTTSRHRPTASGCAASICAAISICWAAR
jgi:outer membrane receptor protein involved in Fe transport